MNTLKIKIKVADTEIELEGEQDIVQRQFQHLKENGIGNLFKHSSESFDVNKDALKESYQSETAVKDKLPKKRKSKTNETKVKGKGRSRSFKLLPNLNFKPKGSDSLIDFITSLPFKSNAEIILGIVFYCKEVLHIERIDSDHIFTGFKELKIPIPPSLYQVIVNTKNRDGWISFDRMDDISYTIQGGNHIEHDLPKKKRMAN